MHVHALAWIVLAGIILTMIAVDIVGHVRTPHEPTLKEATWWSVAYIAIALLFGGIVWAVWGPQYGQEYLGGYITEKALSIDNLFVFVIILSSFRVPRKDQQEVLLAGIVIALILRLIFILAGAALIENFSWVFYIFGAWLLWTAINQVREGVGEEEEDEYRPPSIVRWVSKIVPVTDGFIGSRMLYRHGGRTYLTPMLLCVIAVGTADVMFAVDSIPAIYSLTSEAYLVFAANAFSLLGLRQLYFLIDVCSTASCSSHYGLAAFWALSASNSSTTRCTPTSCPSSMAVTRFPLSLSHRLRSRSVLSWRRFFSRLWLLSWFLENGVREKNLLQESAKILWSDS